MKTKLFFLSFLAVFIYFSCEDSTISEIGTSTMPDEDKIEVYDSIISITLKTIQTDSIYAKTISGAVGEYYDPTFGTLNAGFACQFYPSIGFQNLDNLVDGKIDSVYLDIYYTYMGDSLAPMELTVYPINKPLEKNYYTNVNPDEFADMAHPVVRSAYTTQKWNFTGYNYGMLSVLMPAEWGQKYVNAIRNDTTLNSNKDKFIAEFPGLYLKSTFGSGCMLFVNNTAIDAYTQVVIQYRTKEQGQSYLGGDSIRKRYAYWAVTKEVIQINSYKNTNIDYLFRNDSTTYIKSPAGVFTEVTIPIPEIIQKIGKRQFSSVKLSLSAYPRNEWNYSLNFPGLGGYQAVSSGIAYNLLLIPPDSTKNFFEQQRVANNVTSYMTTFASTGYAYNFNNISNLIRYAIDHKPDEDLKLWLIPVQSNYTYSSQTGYLDYTTSYDLYPSGVALKSNNQKIRIIASDLLINK
ncbi:hypothetical protein AGMMS50239_09040 [Bacteroidia bacterium]|nr:hypothetical protein AGMMS50239_09040 [Bacteroidia bacterium]